MQLQVQDPGAKNEYLYSFKNNRGLTV